MADGTHIEWTDATWNPVTGCSVVSAGCKHCYAMKLAGTRLAHHPSRAGLTIDTPAGPVWNGQVRFNAEWLEQPLRWRRSRMIFVCAHGDLFHESVPDEWIDQVFAVMALAHQHTFQVLTKRAERMRDYLRRRTAEIERNVIESPMAGALVARSMALGATLPGNAWIELCNNDENWRANPDVVRRTPGWPLRHVWLGVSVEHQQAADERIPLLLQTPASVRWISAEPLLGPVDLNTVPPPAGTRPINGATVADISGCLPKWQALPMRAKLRDGIDWVVAGGESGRGARPMHPDWARSLRDQCAGAGVPFLFKQWGSWAPGDQAQCGLSACYDAARTAGWCELNGAFTAGREAQPVLTTAAHVFNLSKRAAGRVLDGVLHDAYPETADA